MKRENFERTLTYITLSKQFSSMKIKGKLLCRVELAYLLPGEELGGKWFTSHNH